MPFKIGDRVRILPGNRVGNSSLLSGSEHVIVSGDVYSDYETAIVRLDADVCTGAAFVRGLELVPAEPRFEVGKKYQNKYSGIKYDCIFTDEEGGLLKLGAGVKFYMSHRLILNNPEYIPEPPKPVHKEGWVRVYMDRTIRDKVGSILYDTENEALQLTSGAALKGRSVSGVRAFKIEWDEVPEASEDDTI